MKTKEQVSQALREGAARRLSDPDELARVTARCQALGQREDVRAKRSANAKAQWSDEDARALRSAIYKERFADPAYREAVLAKRRATIEAKKKGAVSGPLGSDQTVEA